MLPKPPLRLVLPNIVTALSSMCGAMMIWMSATGVEPVRFYHAALLLPLACLFDGLDGRIARALGGESEFGRNFDSLSDLLTFGVAPAFVAYQWQLHRLGIIGAISGFVFVLAMMARLARYSVRPSDENDAERAWFVGLPAPMAGGGVMLMIGLHASWMSGGWTSGDWMDVMLATAGAGSWYAIWMGLLSFLMVSRVSYPSLKVVAWRPGVWIVLTSILAISLVIAVVIHPAVGFAVAYSGYVASPFVLVPGTRAVHSVGRDGEQPWKSAL